MRFVASCLLVAAIGSICPPSIEADDRPGDFALPDSVATPGAIRTATAAELCAMSGSPIQQVSVGPDLTAQVWQRYNDYKTPHDAYVIDWLVPPGLGGEGAIPNLWPQRINGPWNHSDKLKLEAKLRELVCGKKLNLAVAQRALTDNWVTAYGKYVGAYP